MNSDTDAKVAIQERYSRYCFALDSSDGDAFTECFAEDGVFNVVGRAEFAGHQAMRGLVAASVEGRPRHHYLNFWVKSIDGDTAESTAYFLLLDRTNGQTNAYGHYEDRLVRESDGEWRFQDRQVHFEWKSDSYGARPVHGAEASTENS
jgi:uncharacterized protein (TIGR02246 family)